MKKLLLVVVPFLFYSCGNNIFKDKNDILVDSLAKTIVLKNFNKSYEIFDTLINRVSYAYIEYGIKDSFIISRLDSLILHRLHSKNLLDSTKILAMDGIIQSTTDTEFDEFKRTYWLKGVSEPGIANKVNCYIGVKDDKRWIRFNLFYYDDDWVFMDKIEFLADGSTYSLPVSSVERKTKVISGGVKEWIDIEPSAYFLIYLYDASKASDFKYRLVGRENSFTRIVTENEKKGLSEIINAFHLYEQMDSLSKVVSNREMDIKYKSFK